MNGIAVDTPSTIDSEIDRLAWDIRSELRRCARKINLLNSPFVMFYPMANREPESPQWMLCLDRIPRLEFNGSGLKFNSQCLAIPEERLQDLAYDCAGSIWHLKDRLSLWARLTSQDFDFHEYGNRSSQLLIACDLITWKKHHDFKNLSRQHPYIELVQFNTSNSGTVELIYSGASKEAVIFASEPNRIPYRIRVCKGPYKEFSADDHGTHHSLIGYAHRILLEAFQHVIPVLDMLQFWNYQAANPETVAIREICNRVSNLSLAKDW